MVKMSKGQIIAIAIVLILVLALFGTMMYLFARMANSIIGYVYDAQTKEPINGAVVRLYNADEEPPGETYVTKTDEDGYFVFHFMDTNANIRMSAKEEFHYIEYQYYDASEVNKFYLEPGGILNGKVDLGSGANSTKHWVCMADNATRPLMSTNGDLSKSLFELDGNGSFSTGLIKEGQYRFSVCSDGEEPTEWVDVTIYNRRAGNLNLSSWDRPSPLILTTSLFYLENNIDQPVTGIALPVLLLLNGKVSCGGITDLRGRLTMGLHGCGDYSLLIDYNSYSFSYFSNCTIELEGIDAYCEVEIGVAVSIMD